MKPSLVKCVVCGHEVSTSAKACPHCGEPKFIGREKAPKLSLGIFLAVLSAIFIVIAIGTAHNDASNSDNRGQIKVHNDGNDAGPTPPSCDDDWQKCKDNADLVNNWSEWHTVVADCEVTAEQQAKFGTPKWPWIPFGSYHVGKDYIQTGIVTAIEPDAQFQNGFGAMAHVKVYCQYDLRKKTVLSVLVDQG